MYILTNSNKENEDAIMFITEKVGVQEGTGYHLLENENVAIPTEFVKGIYEVEEIPEGVETEKYCYTVEKGFYENENFVEYKTPEQQIEELNQQVTDLQLALAEIVEGGNV